VGRRRGRPVPLSYTDRSPDVDPEETRVFTHILLVNQWQTWVIILVVVLLLFGATRLPALAKSLGQSAKVFRKEIKSDDTDEAPTAQSDQPADKK
jgi:TatA/E family protein of Tat protein translocase